MGVVVLGMHRSGTSAVTNLLHTIGLSCGPAGALLGPDQWNRSGYWEVRTLTAFNEALLRAAGGSEIVPPDPAHDWQDRRQLAGAEQVAGELWQSVFPDDNFAWKDPRTCLTMPFWDGVLPQATVAVLVIRNPLEIVDSLQQRDGRDPVHALALWERYTRAALATASARPAAVVHYADLVDDENGVRSELTEFLRRTVGLPTPVATSSAQPVVRPGLRHAAYQSTTLQDHPLITEQQRDLFAAVSRLRSWHTPREDVLPFGESPHVEPLFKAMRTPTQLDALLTHDCAKQLLDRELRRMSRGQSAWWSVPARLRSSYRWAKARRRVDLDRSVVQSPLVEHAVNGDRPWDDPTRAVAAAPAQRPSPSTPFSTSGEAG
jgi:hypothetical protein